MKPLQIDTILEYFVLVDGQPSSDGDVVVCAKFMPAFDAGEAASQVLWHREGSWYAGPMVECEAVALHFDDELQLATVLGRDGELVQASPDAIVGSSRLVDLGMSEPGRSVGPFRRLCPLDRGLLALGGVRDVYEVSGAAGRLLSHGGVAPLTPESESDALEQALADSDLWFDAAGHDVTDFIAVGSGGRVDEFRRAVRRQVDIGTNLPLYCICKLGEGYFIGGHRGCTFYGGGSTWRSLEVIAEAGNLCSAVEFAGRLFACDGRAVYSRPVTSGPFVVQDMGTASQVPAHRLRASRRWLVSIAGKELFRTADGTLWESLLG